MEIIKLMRTKHYIKNVLIFLPLFFSGQLLDVNNIYRVTFGFIIFCLSASIVYILNDIVDVEKDRAHSTKCNRPIASGAVSVKKAQMTIAILLSLIVIISTLILKDVSSMILPASYMVLNIFYSLSWKNIPIIDVFIISIGFLLRLFYGGIIISVEISSWLFLTVLFGTLFLGFGKRRNELIRESKGTRKSLENYSLEFLNSTLTATLALTLTFYALWTIETDLTGQLTKLTVPIVSLLGFKYYHALSSESSGDPTDIFYQEKWIQLVVVILILLIGKIIYWN